MKSLSFLALSAALVAGACSASTGSTAAADIADATGLDSSGEHPATPLAGAPFIIQEIATFNEPWAMTFLPGTRTALVTEKSGKLKLW